MVKKIKVEIKMPSGMTISKLHVVPETTIRELKEKITFVDPNRQLLRCNDKNIFEERKTLEAYGITNGSVIELECLPSQNEMDRVRKEKERKD